MFEIVCQTGLGTRTEPLRELPGRMPPDVAVIEALCLPLHLVAHYPCGPFTSDLSGALKRVSFQKYGDVLNRLFACKSTLGMTGIMFSELCHRRLLGSAPGAPFGTPR